MLQRAGDAVCGGAAGDGVVRVQLHGADGDAGAADAVEDTLAHAGGDDDDGGFGDFGSADDARSSEAQPAQIPGGDVDDGFGDFGEASGAKAGEIQLARNAGEGDDDFGDFGEAESSASLRAQDGEDADDGFGDFGDFDQAEAFSAQLPPDARDDDGFGDSDEAEGADAQPGQAAEDDDDGFGDFDEAEGADARPDEAAGDDDDGFGDFDEADGTDGQHGHLAAQPQPAQQPAEHASQPQGISLDLYGAASPEETLQLIRAFMQKAFGRPAAHDNGATDRAASKLAELLARMPLHAGGADPLRWATSHARTVLLQACGASATDAVAGAGSSPLQVEASPALLAVLELLPELDYML